MGKQWKQRQTYFGGLQNHWNGDCSHEIKRYLLLGRKVMNNLDSMLKSRDIILPAKVHLSSQSYGFSSTHLWMWELEYKESWVLRTDASELWCRRRLLRVSWTSKRSNQSSLKGNQSWIFIGSTDVEAETLILWPPDAKKLTHLKRPWSWERLKVGGEGDDRGWDGWMTSPTQWRWVWVNSGSWRWTGWPGLLHSMR